RFARQLRTGRHFGMLLQQLPSGRGPSLQGPPASCERVHCHRDPSRRGLHSEVALQFPLLSGPI
ncbi:MAG: hypothetical protein VCB60_10885, partial [Alphaproteobacteria bacterium]